MLTFREFCDRRDIKNVSKTACRWMNRGQDLLEVTELLVREKLRKDCEAVLVELS